MGLLRRFNLGKDSLSFQKSDLEKIGPYEILGVGKDLSWQEFVLRKRLPFHEMGLRKGGYFKIWKKKRGPYKI